MPGRGSRRRLRARERHRYRGDFRHPGIVRSPVPGFSYDAFISYAHEDKDWALRIAEDLARKGQTTFVDRQNTRIGELWDERLQSALEESRHLIVLSSEHSKKSRWVGSEVVLFRSLRREDPWLSGRIMPVNLDAQDEFTAQFQAIDDIREAGVYAEGPDGVDPSLWGHVIRRLAEEISGADPSRPVPALIVTTTRDAIEQVDPAAQIQRAAGGSVTLGEMTASLSIDRATLLSSYGATRRDWRPFGSTEDIHTILDQIKDDINLKLVTADMPRFRWDFVDEEFWSDAADIAARRLAHGPSLVVLDPLSLCDAATRTKTNEFLMPQIRENDEAVVIVLPPYAMPANASALRASIEALAWELFHAYHDPPVERTRRARYLAGVGDAIDLKVGLVNGLGPSLVAPPRPSENVWTAIS
jgi:hypothetical protein